MLYVVCDLCSLEINLIIYIYIYIGFNLRSIFLMAGNLLVAHIAPAKKRMAFSGPKTSRSDQLEENTISGVSKKKQKT